MSFGHDDTLRKKNFDGTIIFLLLHKAGLNILNWAEPSRVVDGNESKSIDEQEINVYSRVSGQMFAFDLI